MYASLIEVKLKPGSSEEVTELLGAMRSGLEAIDGLRQLIVVDKGDDTFSEVVIYETESQWESARPQVQQLMMPLIEFLADMPQTVGGTVVMNDNFG
jgi:heme-degrading monooxygenase HmoA